MTTPQFAILRVEKIKSFGELRARGKHNRRDTERGVEHCDRAKPPISLHKRPEATPEAAWDARAKRAGLDRSGVRKNGVVAIEWLATASPEFFKGKSPKQVAEWAQDSLAHIEKQAGGPQNILSAHLHMDESTPHIQIISIPLAVKMVRGKSQRRLTAKDFIGGPRDRLVQLQDEYHAAVAHHGLERGKPRKETGARNKPPSVWRREQREAAQAARVSQQQATEHARAAAALKEQAAADAEKAAQFLSKNREAARALVSATKAADIIKKPRVAQAIKTTQGRNDEAR